MLHRNEFTAGPWGKRAAMGSKEELLFWDVARIEDVYRGTVCSVYDAENIGGITEEECEANTNLIAAAPEMYAALQQLCDNRGVMEWLEMHSPCIREAAEEALTKARGEVPIE